MRRPVTCCLVFTLLTGASALAQDGGSTIIPKREVNEVLLQGLDNLAAGSYRQRHRGETPECG